MALDNSDTQKTAQRQRNRKAQMDRRARSKANEDTITVLRWELRKIVRATLERDFVRVQTIIGGLEPSLLGGDHESTTPALQWSDSFSDVPNTWATSPPLFDTADFNLPLPSLTDFGIAGQDASSLYQMFTDANTWTHSAIVDQTSNAVVALD
ncbi:unnamed protein product [Fusarium langsethiae]|nr:unnamed protein product [Fusarium langsethiae]GKU16620.1 unnamed protein product [Fusarium langsethiae]